MNGLAASVVLAVDPGREKCGVAVLDRSQGTLWQRIVPTGDLADVVEKLLPEFACRTLVLGDRTFSGDVRRVLQPLLDKGLADEIFFIEEHGSTEQAKSRYWQAFPPTGWRRLLPLGLLSPPCAVDDFAAIILGERYFAKKI